MADPGVTFPEYCCAILRDGAGRYLMEKRPTYKGAASGLLTCFGGGRHDGEHPDACIRRELLEELGWEIGDTKLDMGVRLVGERAGKPREIAWFYRANAPGPDVKLVTEPGVEAVWVDFLQTQDAATSSWHRAALAAERTGERVARV